MERRKQKVRIRVGIFVFIAVIFLFACIILLGQNRTFFSLVSKYKVEFSSVNGLFVGGVVTVNGVSAGNVLKIQFLEDTGKVEVVLSVLRRFAPVITNQTTAALGTKGLLGDKYVALTVKGKTGNPLPAGSYIPVRSEIGGASEGMDVKISGILDELLILIRGLNSQDTVKHFGEAVKDLSTMLSKEHAKELSQILKRLNSILKKLDDGEGSVGALINDRNVYNRILSLLGRRPYDQFLPSLMEKEEQK